MRLGVLLRRIGGTTVFVVGIVSLILPVLPGWFFIGLGLYILSLDSPGMQSRLDALAKKYPHFDKVLLAVERRFGVAGERQKRYTDQHKPPTEPL